MEEEMRGGKAEREMQRGRRLLCSVSHSINSAASECITQMRHNYCLIHFYENLSMSSA